MLLGAKQCEHATLVHCTYNAYLVFMCTYNRKIYGANLLGTKCFDILTCHSSFLTSIYSFLIFPVFLSLIFFLPWFPLSSPPRLSFVVSVCNYSLPNGHALSYLTPQCTLQLNNGRSHRVANEERRG